jgi:hypothetical protein
MLLSGELSHFSEQTIYVFYHFYTIFVMEQNLSASITFSKNAPKGKSN